MGERRERERGEGWRREMFQHNPHDAGGVLGRLPLAAAMEHVCARVGMFVCVCVCDLGDCKWKVFVVQRDSAILAQRRTEKAVAM